MGNFQGEYQPAVCLKVNSYEDGRDGDGNYRLVFQLEHKGHQSYGQRFTVDFEKPLTVQEVPGDVMTTVQDNSVTFERNNQLNENGFTEIWVKLAAESQPKVLEIRNLACKEKIAD